MQFRKLQLLGFKTFADRTEIELGDGMTAVVGPNGCGKSNVADALLWVMGEQNPRLLRGADSRDVIFAGTSRRKPLGLAEVRLTVDNSDHALPVDFAEVSIARRVYRSGESQYYLNQSPCRLKDIVDLFLDTGIGDGAYAFVTQNEIDAVLSARAEDRRELFEEAAGIKKYRVRKREAVRKLEHTEANLTRIRDIAHELERERGSLERQAQVALRHRELTTRLRQIEVDLLVAEAQTVDYELYAARRDCEMDREAIARHEAEMAALERESETCRAGLEEAERELEAARMARQSALTLVERTESRLSLLEERGAAAEQSAGTLDEELRDLDARVADLTRQAAEAEALAAKLDQQESASRDHLTAARAQLRTAEKALAEALQRSEDTRGALRRQVQLRAEREAALSAASARLAEARARLGGDRDAAAKLAAERDAAVTAAADAVRGLEALRRDAEGISTTCADRRRALQEAEQSRQSARERADALKRRIADREARLSALREMQQAGEGLYQGVRAVLSARRSGRLPGSYAPVVDLLQVPEELRVAIEVALGSAAQDIVCDTEDEARAAIDWLKQNRAGRATFLALPLLRPPRAMAAASFGGLPGIIGVASTLVSTDARYVPVVHLLLGRTLVTRDMDAAIRAARTGEGWSRIVTLEGEVLAPGGALTGGSLQGKGTHLVGRKGEIDDLSRAVPALRAESDAADTEAARMGAEAHDLAAELQRLEGEHSAVQARVAASAANLNAAEREKARLAAACDQSNHALGALASTVAELEEAERTLRQSAETSIAGDATADDAVAAEEAEVARRTAEREHAVEQVSRAQIETARLAEKRGALQSALGVTRAALAQAETSRAVKQRRREETASSWADAASQAEELRSALEAARQDFERCDARHGEWQTRRQERLAASFEKATALKEIAARRQQTTEEMHEAELRIARLEVRLAQTAQRLTEEYSIGLDEAIARPAPHDVGRDVASEVARLRREIRQMGDVNTGAVEEFERLTERHTFLEAQREDIERARASILETIDEIDKSTREVFMQTFDAVSVEFQRLFERLFEGGTTTLTLTRPDDLLETGIEVTVQPPGKKAQKLSLLSGGERALTAVALLFAFLRVRPSPFAVLDEVDAPLDGLNVERFVQLVEEFSRNTQFLVITHNPTTMEAAPRWYGITMQEPGVSRVISYRVPEEAVASVGETPIVPAGAAPAK